MSVMYDRLREIPIYDRLVEIGKGNPYHDPKTGKFTNAPGGSGGVPFAPAGSMDEAREYARNQLGFSGRVDYSYSYIDQKEGRQVTGSLDMETVNHINKTITEIQDRYPEMKGVVSDLGCSTRSVYAEVVHNGRDGSLSLLIGAKAHKDGLQATYDAWEGDVGLGYHPKGTTGDAILWHEYGHVYASMANGSGKTVRDKLKAVSTREAETGWKNDAAKKLGVDPSSFAENVSRYSTMDAGELFAEAFGAHNTGNSTKWTDALMEAAGADRRAK